MSLIRPFHLLIATLVVSLLAAAPVAAQQAAQQTAQQVGPTMHSNTVGVRAIQPLATSELAPMHYDATNRNITLMIVGGAGLLIGSIIGGDTGTIVMVGSGVIGLIGLFRYLN